MNVVVVESPAKAKTINKYLGSDYTVLASYGHIRDLPSKDGSVRPDDDFSMDWEIDARAKKHIDAIAKALKGADHLYLATDPDREGEAISWHIQEILEKKKSLADVTVKRVVFNEITKSAILAAFETPRDVDQELVDAYLARRALDYLVGFTLSPVLWRKLPGSKSAGRVQSVALRLICERESEIEIFQPQEYWSVEGTFRSAGKAFTARLTHFNGDKLDKLSLADRQAADAAVAAVENGDFTVAKVERKQARRHPSPPFTTSTLQQEAARKLHFSTKRTMQVAQKLYEGVNIGGETVGLITYMRTDGVTMAGEAVAACRSLIGDRYGEKYLPGEPRAYKSKAKNAQEAHEAIRPTDAARRPENVASYLNDDQKKLYDLIWKRTVASQMESAVLDQVAADLKDQDGKAVMRATGSVVAFDGFFKLYQEGRDDSENNGKGDDNTDRILPDLRDGQPVERTGVKSEQHFTQPPPRYSEASLVKKLEELGIGRPSTYASILTVLQDRSYVTLEKRRFTPDDRGRLVTAFLSSFFTKYVEYNFTADLENKLDDISGGLIDWKVVLREFWGAFYQATEETKKLSNTEVIDIINDILSPHFFPPRADGKDPHACQSCADGRLNIKPGRYGAFIGCTNYPDCRYTRPLAVANGDEAEEITSNGPKELGLDPATGLMVTLRKGPYGYYVQLGEPEGEGKAKTKPKRASLAKGTDPATVDLEIALGLLALPRDIGTHPESGELIQAGLGRYGPYIKHGGIFISLKGDDDVLSIGMNRACELIAESPKKAQPKAIGEHPKDGKPITLRAGRFGPYVQHGTIRATLPKGTAEDDVTLDQAVELIAAKEAKNGKGAKKKATPKKKTAAKKKAAPKKKSAPKKSTAADTAAEG